MNDRLTDRSNESLSIRPRRRIKDKSGVFCCKQTTYVPPSIFALQHQTKNSRSCYKSRAAASVCSTTFPMSSCTKTLALSSSVQHRGSTYIRTRRSSPALAKMLGLVGCQATALTIPGEWASNSATGAPVCRRQMYTWESVRMLTLVYVSKLQRPACNSPSLPEMTKFSPAPPKHDRITNSACWAPS